MALRVTQLELLFDYYLMATKNEIDISAIGSSTGYNEEANDVLGSVPLQDRLGEFVRQRNIRLGSCVNNDPSAQRHSEATQVTSQSHQTSCAMPHPQSR